jgi:DNA polymerase-3 subunit chi
MTEVAFYHLTRSSLEDALPKLLGKTLEAGKRALVVVEGADKVEALTTSLWVDNASSWLPHGSIKDGRPEDQPIWLTDSPQNQNAAEFVFLADGVDGADLGDFERCFELFDGTSDESVQVARAHWKAYLDQGHALAYWQQTESGGWQKKDT